MKGGVDLKTKYGEVLSPEFLVNEMLDMLPGEVFGSSGLWVDPGAGRFVFLLSIKIGPSNHSTNSNIL